MRKPVDATRIRMFLDALGKRFRHGGRVYLVGGTTLVLKGLRAQTVDVGLTWEIDPAHATEFVDAVRELKETLDLNVEEVSPGDFIPLPEGHESRAIYEGTFGALAIYHFDPCSTALSKIERGTEKDFDDVKALLRAGLIAWTDLEQCFSRVMQTYGRESLRQDAPRFRRHFEALRAEAGRG
jgi:hypothetical protein